MATKSTVDKWKTKQFFEVRAPGTFRESIIGETMATSARDIPGRTISVSYGDMIGDSNPRQQRIKLHFRVAEVRGNRALTQFEGHSLAQDYERSLVRRRTTKIYNSQIVVTKDKQRIRVKSFVVTSRIVNRAMQSDLQEKLQKFVAAEATEKRFDDFILEVISGKMSGKAKREIAKVYPLRHAMIQKTEIINPTFVASEKKKVETEKGEATAEGEVKEEKKEEVKEEKKEEVKE